MKAWRCMQAMRNKHVDKEKRWGKEQAKRMTVLFVHGHAQPSGPLMKLVMRWMPVELEGPSNTGRPVLGNIWELEK